MNKQVYGITPANELDPSLPLYVRGNRPADRAKSNFLITHPLQITGGESRNAVAGTVGMSFLDELQPFVSNDLLIFENAGAEVPRPVQSPKIHIIGLGDVGMHCALGLRLLGGDTVSIGLFARNREQAEGLCKELLQCRPPEPGIRMPDVDAVDESRLLACDALVFAASAGVPKTIPPGFDVRMMQFEKNRAILDQYLDWIASEGFSGTLFILSDPVDALCAYAAKRLAGILPRERIIGLGLGVMAARAAYYAEESAPEYLNDGRAYGPHGEGLWIANSLSGYDDARSEILTEQAKTANLVIRAHGLKPFYGPSLSSGSFSLLAWARGEWFYGAMALSDVYFGCRIRQKNGFLAAEYNNVPPLLARRLDDTMDILRRSL